MYDEHDHGSRWICDLPLRAGCPTSVALRSLNHTRTTLSIGDVQHTNVVCVLADVTNGVETWRVFNCEEN